MRGMENGTNVHGLTTEHHLYLKAMKNVESILLRKAGRFYQEKEIN